MDKIKYPVLLFCYLLLIIFPTKTKCQPGVVNLSGKVVDLLYDGVDSVKVAFYSLSPNLPSTISTMTDELGYFTLDSVMPVTSAKNRIAAQIQKSKAFAAANKRVEYFDLKGRLINSIAANNKPISPYCLIKRTDLNGKKYYQVALSNYLPLYCYKEIIQNGLPKTSLYQCAIIFTKAGYDTLELFLESPTIADIGSIIIKWSEIKLISPNGGELYKISDLIPIEYFANPNTVTSVSFQLSVDGGKHWRYLFTGPKVTGGIFTINAILPDSIEPCKDSINSCIASTIW